MKQQFFILAVFLFPFFAFATGGMVGNGGDSVLQEFNLRGIQMAGFFRSEPQFAAKFGIDGDKFLQTVRKLKLEGQDHLTLAGQEVDAINYPFESRIEVSRSRWLESAVRPDAYFVQRRISLHEYLWMYGLNDGGYAISNTIIAQLEAESGAQIDPRSKALLHGWLCDKVMALDFSGAKELLAWGFDLNEDCPSHHGTPKSLLVAILDSFKLHPGSDDLEFASDRWRLIKAMLEFGADPNQNSGRYQPYRHEPILIPAFEADILFGHLLLTFGANPNLLDEVGTSAFSWIARDNKVMKPAIFDMLIEAGGDLNLSANRGASPAQSIVSMRNNAATVESLIKNGSVDWCTVVDPTQRRTIDFVLSEYLPLIDQYKIKCGRFAKVIGEGATCEDARADGKYKCTAKDFEHAFFDPRADVSPATAGPCAQMEATKYWAYFHCSD